MSSLALPVNGSVEESSVLLNPIKDGVIESWATNGGRIPIPFSGLRDRINNLTIIGHDLSSLFYFLHPTDPGIKRIEEVKCSLRKTRTVLDRTQITIDVPCCRHGRLVRVDHLLSSIEAGLEHQRCRDAKIWSYPALIVVSML